MATPTLDEVYAAILAPGTQWTRRLQVFEADATTSYLNTNALINGSVSVDGSRDERRTLQCTVDNSDQAFNNFPRGFWYDKVIKVFRGIILPDGRTWEGQIGEFLSDGVESDNFPHEVKITGRDYTKKLILSKFVQTTAFVAETPIETVVKAVAQNGGIVKFQLPVTGKALGKDYVFDKGTTRWKCISDICEAFGYEVFFDPQGYLVMREYLDPVTSPLAITFITGPTVGNLVKFTKKSSDTRIYNHVVVTGASSDANTPPVWAEAINTEPSSPTSIQNMKQDRVYEYASPFLTTYAQCLDTAKKFLRIHALEQFQVDMQSLVFPWLEANTIARFVDPSPSQADPERYLLTGFNIPIKLGAMSASASRVTIIT